MDLGDFVVVTHPGHPMKGARGKIVGRRGGYRPDDFWYLVYLPSRMRSYLIPGSALELEKVGPAAERDYLYQSSNIELKGWPENPGEQEGGRFSESTPFFFISFAAPPHENPFVYLPLP